MSDRELSIGDSIAVSIRFGRGYVLHKIIRVTPTMYVCESIRFKRNGLVIVGTASGGGFGPYRGSYVTQEIMMQVRLQKAAASLKELIVTAENVDAVEALLIGKAMQARQGASHE